MRRFFGLLGMGLLTCGWLAADDEMLIVRGVEGEAVYGEQFDEEMALWEAAAKVAGVPAMVVQPDGKESQGERVLNEIEGVISRAPSRLWLVMTGHGTFDGREARFTVEGEDLMPEDVVEALQGFEGELVFVHSGSASQPFGKALAGPKRICVTATKSGSEVFLTHFGVPFAKAIGGEPKADLDQDGQVSVLEAFLHAAEQRLGKPVERGQFGADMQVSLVNDGPVTVLIDTKDRE